MKTMFITALCATVMLIPHARLAAEEEKPSPAIRLLEVMKYQETAEEAAAGMFDPMLKQFEQMGLPAEAILEIKGAFERFMSKTFSDPAILAGLAEIYEKNFTPAEIQDLILFYDTPLGRKVLATQADITAASMELGMKAAEKNQAEFEQEMMQIMEKHQPKPPGDLEE